MEDNMGQVNTMIGNLRNMAVDMGSELENQNKQVDRINRKVILINLNLTEISITKISVAYKFTNNHSFDCVFASTHRANQMNLE